MISLYPIKPQLCFLCFFVTDIDIDKDKEKDIVFVKESVSQLCRIGRNILRYFFLDKKP